MRSSRGIARAGAPFDVVILLILTICSIMCSRQCFDGLSPHKAVCLHVSDAQEVNSMTITFTDPQINYYVEDIEIAARFYTETFWVYRDILHTKARKARAS